PPRPLFTPHGPVTADTLSLESESRGLLEDIQLILLGFGVQSAVYDIDPVLSPQSSVPASSEGGAFAGGRLSDRPVATGAAEGAAAPGPRSGVTGSIPRGDAIPRRHG